RLLCQRIGPPPGLPSFPTRRSSDLLFLHVGRRFGDFGWRHRVEIERMRSAVADRTFGAVVVQLDREIGARHHIEAFHDHTVADEDRKSTRLNSSHSPISYAAFCLKN